MDARQLAERFPHLSLSVGHRDGTLYVDAVPGMTLL